MLHGCEIGDGSLIGIGSTILNGTKIGKNCLIGAHTLIPVCANLSGPDSAYLYLSLICRLAQENKVIPDNSMVMQQLALRIE
jgi:carbonic anhydrase/acetyltransferase-like protein (isoleucine patch superfamily)